MLGWVLRYICSIKGDVLQGVYFTSSSPNEPTYREDNERKKWFKKYQRIRKLNSIRLQSGGTKYFSLNGSERVKQTFAYLWRPGSLGDVKESWSQRRLSCSTFDFVKGFCWAKQSICHSHQKVIYQQTACRVNRATSLWAAQSHHPQKVITISGVAQWQ